MGSQPRLRVLRGEITGKRRLPWRQVCTPAMWGRLGLHCRAGSIPKGSQWLFATFVVISNCLSFGAAQSNTNSTPTSAPFEYEEWSYIHYLGLIAAAWVIIGICAACLYASFEEPDPEEEENSEKKDAAGDGQKGDHQPGENGKNGGGEQHYEEEYEDEVDLGVYADEGGDTNANGHPLPEGWELWPPPHMSVHTHTA